MQVPKKEFLDSMHGEQLRVMSAFDSRKYRYYCVMWHRRARKTTMAVNLLIREAASNPKRTYVYVAPTYKQAKNILWSDPHMLWHWLPHELIARRSDQELYVQLKNGSRIVLKGADNPDSLRGINCHGVIFDEWAEVTHPEIWPAIFRPILAQDPDRWAMFIFTPKGQNHAYETKCLAESSDEWYYSRFVPSHMFNGKSNLLTTDELRKASNDMPKSLFEQEFGCSFITDEEQVLITSRMLDDLAHRGQVQSLTPRKFISIDPAMGGDELVAYAWSETEIIDELIIHSNNPDHVFTEVSLMAKRNDIREMIIETDGIGHLVAEQFKRMGYVVHRFQAGGEANNKNRFRNLKAEAWWNAFEMINRCEVHYPHDMQLRRQISSVRFKPGSRLFQMETKADTKRSLGHSPDRADAWIIGLWGLSRIRPGIHRDAWKEAMRRRRESEEMSEEYVFNAATG